MKEVYVVCCECNDKGWGQGSMCFTDANEAIKHMRDYVSGHIMYLRREGYKVDNLRVWSDRVLDAQDRIESQTITFYADKNYKRDFYDFRIFAKPVWETNDDLRKRCPWNM